MDESVAMSTSGMMKGEGLFYELQRLAEEVEVHADTLSQLYSRIDGILGSSEPVAAESPGDVNPSVSDVVDRVRILIDKIANQTSQVRSITRRVTL